MYDPNLCVYFKDVAVVADLVAVMATMTLEVAEMDMVAVEVLNRFWICHVVMFIKQSTLMERIHPHFYSENETCFYMLVVSLSFTMFRWKR